MTDIVDRLRGMDNGFRRTMKNSPDPNVLREAADRIVTLRARVDLLEGELRAVLEFLESQYAVSGGTITESFIRTIRRKLAALDAATRSADTDGDEAQGLHGPAGHEVSQ